MKKFYPLLFSSVVAGLSMPPAHALGKKAATTQATDVEKKVVKFNALSDVSIDLPPTGLNGATFTPQSYDFGPNLLAALRVEMEDSSKYLVQIPVAASPMTAQALTPEVIVGGGVLLPMIIVGTEVL
jgi:hypothetical protein